MASNTAPQEHTVLLGEDRNVSVSFAGKLDAGETLTGTPSVTATPSGLTFSNEAVNDATVYVNGANVPAGKAVQFSVSGGAEGQSYTLTVSCGSSAGQTLKGRCRLSVEA